MKRLKSQVKSNFVLFWICLLPCIVINLTIVDTYVPFQILNCCLIVWCAIRLFPIQSWPISTNTITYLFIYFFFGIAPLYQFATHISIWGGRPILGDDYFITTLFIFIGILIYDLTYHYYKRHKRIGIILNDKKVSFSYKNALIISVLSMIWTLYVFKSQPSLLIMREITVADEKIGSSIIGNTSISLLYTIIIRPIPVITLIYCNFATQKLNVYTYILLIISLITNFPLSLPRFYVAGIYLPLIVSFWPKIINKSVFFKLLFIVGILYIFPFLNQGRTVTDVSQVEINLSPNYDMFTQGHFDTFQNGVRVIRDNFVTYGRQLLGAILFWFPRSIWPTKPIGSGGVIAKEFNLNFDHISLNYWAEGWLNFGILGLILFSIILGAINSTLDYKIENCKTGITFKVGYLLYMGMLIFMLRGDMISSIAYMVGLLVISFICSKLEVKKI